MEDVVWPKITGTQQHKGKVLIVHVFMCSGGHAAFRRVFYETVSGIGSAGS